MAAAIQTIEQLKDIHRGRTFAVIGGGCSLPEDLDKLPPDVILIGVNQHANLLKPEYITFTDPPVALLLTKMKDTVLISPRKTGVIDGVVWATILKDFGFSGADGVQLAEYMGSARTILCGIDCYTGPRRYWYDLQPSPRSKYEFTEQQRDMWMRIKAHLKRPEVVRAASGPLIEVFGGVDE
jgi:hypothetical protein